MREGERAALLLLCTCVVCVFYMGALTKRAIALGPLDDGFAYWGLFGECAVLLCFCTAWLFMLFRFFPDTAYIGALMILLDLAPRLVGKEPDFGVRMSLFIAIGITDVVLMHKVAKQRERNKAAGLTQSMWELRLDPFWTFAADVMILVWVTRLILPVEILGQTDVHYLLLPLIAMASADACVRAREWWVPLRR